MKQVIKTTFQYVLTGAVLIAILTAIGPLAEGLLSPPLKVTQATRIADTANYTDVLLIGVKARDCLLMAGGAKVRANDRWISGTVTLQNQDGTELKKEDQVTAIGTPFVRVARVAPAGDMIHIYATSKCHVFWNTTMHIATIK